MNPHERSVLVKPATKTLTDLFGHANVINFSFFYPNFKKEGFKIFFTCDISAQTTGHI